MQAKRSRIIRSSSQGEIGLSNQVKPIDPPKAVRVKKLPAPVTAPKVVAKPAQKPVAKNPKSQPVAKQVKKPNRSILTLGSPFWELDDEGTSRKKLNEGFGEFLKACSLCKKKLQEDKDVFMYGYLKAFCSPDCRDDQIALDGFQKQDSSNRKAGNGRKRCA